MLLRFALQTLFTALSVGLVTWLFPGVRAQSVPVVVGSAVFIGVGNALIRPMLRFTLHPVTVPWVVLMALLVNTFAVVLAEPFTQVWAFDNVASGVSAVVIISAVASLLGVVPLTGADRRLSRSLNERKTPGAGPIERHPQLELEEEEDTAAS